VRAIVLDIHDACAESRDDHASTSSWWATVVVTSSRWPGDTRRMRFVVERPPRGRGSLDRRTARLLSLMTWSAIPPVAVTGPTRGRSHADAGQGRFRAELRVVGSRWSRVDVSFAIAVNPRQQCCLTMALVRFFAPELVTRSRLTLVDRLLSGTRPAVGPRAGGSWLSRPLSRGRCALGWLFATVLFIEVTHLLGGLTSGDASDSINTTWAIAHGQLACSYAPGNQFGLPFTAPLYPLLSGGLAALLGIGHQVPFPTSAALGSHCATAISSMYHWSLHSKALAPTLRLGFVGWLAIMAGAVALLRTSGRGRTGWEPVTLAVLAIAPPVFMSLHEYFHPQDLLAVGLILGGVACVRRGSWVWAGLLLGLAFTSQQFALLVVAPLIVIAPPKRLLKFVAALAGTVVVVVLPLAVFAPKAALEATFAGSGTTWTSATLLDAAHLSGPWLFFLSRFMPVAGAMLLAWWVQRRLEGSVMDPVPLVSLLATSLSLRLLFEVNLWGYYFMAVAVLVLIADVLRGRVRWTYFAWLALVLVAFHPIIGVDRAWVAQVTPWLPLWTWQLVLAPAGTVLAVGPLVDAVRLQHSWPKMRNDNPAVLRRHAARRPSHAPLTEHTGRYEASRQRDAEQLDHANS